MRKIAPLSVFVLAGLAFYGLTAGVSPPAQAAGSDAISLDREAQPLAVRQTPFTTLFGGDARWLVPAQGFAKWRDMTDRAARNGGPSNPGWTNLISRLSYAGERDQIDGVQGAFNAIHYGTDEFVWGSSDYWASPAELLQRAQGDSEDIAIAKYYALRALGFSADSMRILIEQPGFQATPEAILLVSSAGSILELNYQGDTRLFQRGLNRREVYSLNEKYVWMHRPRPGEPAKTPGGQIAEVPVVDFDDTTPRP